MYRDPIRLPVSAAVAIFDVHPEVPMRSEKAGRAKCAWWRRTGVLAVMERTDVAVEEVYWE